MICLPQEQRSLQYLLNFLWKFGTKPISDSLSQIEGRSEIVKIFEKDAKFSEKLVRCKVSGKQLRFRTALQTEFFKIERRNIMITYHNRTHMTAVPTELLQDTHLSVEAKGFAAILYALGDEGVELSELACQLNMPEERISVVLTELADTDYLQIRKEGDDEFCLELRGM